MSLHESADVESIGTTEPDDAPTTLEPTMTTVVTETTANGPAGELLGYVEFAACVTLATATITRVVQGVDR